ncbi:MAG TPA: lysogenization regulator HflD [Chromatiales bacterium]|nr:high frequency lysogenization protein HflD [Thiotrichales bacterium]HIP67945.1 lysogenization regulator HflD [Chromatiales bacterium]
MQKNIRNRTLSLAALLQCCAQVKQIAESGQSDLQQARVLLNSVFNNRANTIEEIYGGLTNLKPGLILLNDYLNTGRGTAERDMELTRYAINLLYLQGKLEKNASQGQAMLDELEQASKQLDYFDDILHPSVVGRIADCYQKYISPLGGKIIVKGDQQHLENQDNAALIRALLLAGIRAAVLWRQAGGSRLKLLFQRTGLLKETHALLNNGV